MSEINPFWITAGILAVTTLVGVGVWIGNVNSDRTSFKKFMDSIESKISEINQDIKNILVRLTPDVTSRGSPIRLTDLGERVSEIIGAKGMAESLSRELHPQTINMTDYEIQEFTKDYALFKFEPSPAQSIVLSDCAFQEGIPIESVRSVIGIELRDKLIAMKRASQ